MVGQTVRFMPVNREIKQVIAEGAIGRLRLLHVTWYTGHVWPGGWRAWQLDPRRSGGHPVHNGIHALDLAVWLYGQRPVRVFARGFRTFSPATGIPDSFHVTVRFADGSLALIELSYALRTRGDSLRRILAVGETGTVQHSTEHEACLYSDAARPPSPSVHDAMYAQLAHWVATLQGKEPPIVKVEEVRAALAAQRSLETGGAVEVEEGQDG